MPEFRFDISVTEEGDTADEAYQNLKKKLTDHVWLSFSFVDDNPVALDEDGDEHEFDWRT